jgi:hypothetical protein
LIWTFHGPTAKGPVPEFRQKLAGCSIRYQGIKLCKPYLDVISFVVVTALPKKSMLDDRVDVEDIENRVGILEASVAFYSVESSDRMSLLHTLLKLAVNTTIS